MSLRRPRGLTDVAVLSAVILAAAVLSRPALRDAVTGVAPAGARLVRPPRYVAVAPLADVFDAVSLLAVPQLIAFFAGAILLYALWRTWRWRREGGSLWNEFCAGLRALLLLILFVLAVAVAPRPMAALALDDPELLAFDIHSHTSFSHDARATFTVARDRDWHRASGFQVAYVTDHRCFDGAAEGERGNPARAGDGTVLLSGIELPPEDAHVIALEPADAPVRSGLLERWCLRARAGGPLARPPVRIFTIPEDLARLQAAPPGASDGVIAIELLDGAPRGLAQAQRDRVRILRLADSLDLALVAGSNNHGWGYTAVAWNVMRVPGWRALTPDSVRTLIEDRIRTRRRSAVSIITRIDPLFGRSRLATVFALPLVALSIVTTISLPERISWVVWLFAAAGCAAWRKRA